MIKFYARPGINMDGMLDSIVSPGDEVVRMTFDEFQEYIANLGVTAEHVQQTEGGEQHADD